MERETSINTGAYDFGARIYDSRLGRFLSVDPMSRAFAAESNYSFAGNSPILFIDVAGKFKWPSGEQGAQLAECYPTAYKYLADINNADKSILKLAHDKVIMEKILNNIGGNLAAQGWYIPTEFRQSIHTMSEAEITEAFTPGMGPELMFTLAPGGSSPITNGGNPNAGGFNESNNGKLYDAPIEINERMLMDLENAKTPEESQAALTIIYSTVVHEYLEYFGYDEKIAKGKGGEKAWGAAVGQRAIFGDISFNPYDNDYIRSVISIIQSMGDNAAIPEVE